MTVFKLYTVKPPGGAGGAGEGDGASSPHKPSITRAGFCMEWTDKEAYEAYRDGMRSAAVFATPSEEGGSSRATDYFERYFGLARVEELTGSDRFKRGEWSKLVGGKPVYCMQAGLQQTTM